MIKKEKFLAKIIILSCFCASVCALLVFNGYFWPNSYFANQYPVRGIDVSSHQNMIDWNTVSQNKEIHFVYIKASEGMDYQDREFKRNWAEAKRCGLLTGAYHYFKTTSAGLAQARNFTSIVPNEKGSLPPVVDVEEEGLEDEQFRRELKAFLGELESFYRQKPVIYTTYPLYDRYISHYYSDYPIWIRDVMWAPSLSDNRAWDFWQYCNRGRIEGIDAFVDIDVYAKDQESLQRLASQ